MSGGAGALGKLVLGSDSFAFRTTMLCFVVREWDDVNMVDIMFASMARRRSITLVKISRYA